ncbi:MAG: hypothetical protein IPJ60_02045 [Sphingobacteriaceae bacterium]|nr:hypothetical protein [Sphingobacteriaceae bacterium]
MNQAHTTLEQIWIIENKPEGDYIVWAKAQSSTDLSKEQKDLQTLNDLLFQFKSIQIKHTESGRALNAAKASKTSKVNAEKRLKEAQAENNKINSSLLKLLQEAKTYISGQQQIDKCPVCDSDINKTKVINTLDLQIKSMSELDKATQALNIATKAHESNIAIYRKAIQAISNHIINYRNSIQGYKSHAPEITSFVDGIGQDPKTNFDCYIKNASQLQTLNSKIDASQKKKNKNIEQHNSIKQNYKVITDNTEKVGN